VRFLCFLTGRLSNFLLAWKPLNYQQRNRLALWQINGVLFGSLNRKHSGMLSAFLPAG